MGACLISAFSDYALYNEEPRNLSNDWRQGINSALMGMIYDGLRDGNNYFQIL